MARTDKAGEGEDDALADATAATHRLVRWCTGSKPGSLPAGLAGPPGQRSRLALSQLVTGPSRLRSPLAPSTTRRCRQVAGHVLVRVRVAPQLMAGNTGLVHIGYTCGRKTAADVGQRYKTFAQVSRRFSGRPA
jgi:hypothetical protein